MKTFNLPMKQATTLSVHIFFLVLIASGHISSRTFRWCSISILIKRRHDTCRFAKWLITLPNLFGSVITYFLEVLIIVVYSICCLSRCNMKSKLQQQFINDDEIYKTKWRALNLKKNEKKFLLKMQKNNKKN